MAQRHNYEVLTRWTGNLGTGTSEYRAYSRAHEIEGQGKRGSILGSSDPAFRGDSSCYNPEELLVASLSACHMLWYLHLCALARIAVVEYVDNAQGTMLVREDGPGHFTEVVLRPRVTVVEAEQLEDALNLHQEAHSLCFIANSVNFPVRHIAEVHQLKETGKAS
ncbi:MAG: OsmC family protein [Myxococcaceae bacterium]